MRTNNSVVPSRTENPQPERAGPETAKAAFDAIRKDLNHDPMAAQWDDFLTGEEKRVTWLYAKLPGADDGEFHRKWSRLPENYRERLNKVISKFSGLCTRVKGAVA